MKKKTTKLLALLLALAMMLSTLAGCSSSSSDEGEDESEGSSSSTSESSAEGEEEEESSTEKNVTEAVLEEYAEKDEDADYSAFRIGVTSLSTSLNPNMIESAYGDLIYSCLAKTDRKTGETIGYMCDISWSDDKLTIYVDLYENVYDTDGNHITASDVVFCWDTAKEAGSRQVNDYESWEQTGEYSLEFHLKEVPNMDGAQLSAYIYSQAAYEASADGFATMPVGTGIYKVQEFTTDYNLILERNEDFWATDEQRAIVEEHYGALWDANWDTLEWWMISETTQMTVALEAGNIDFSSSVASDELVLFKDGGSMSDEYNVYNYVGGLTTALFFNTDEASPFSDVRLRQAVCYAIDIDYVIDMLYAGDAVATHEMGSPYLLDYNSDWDTEDNYYQYDPDKAMELLEEAGYGDGSLELTFMLSSGSDLGVCIQSQLQAVGITCNLLTLDQNLQREYKTNDRSSWDIQSSQVGSEDYIWNAWDKTYVQGENAWEGTSGYYVDDTLAAMLTAVCSVDGYSEEAVEEFHEYTIPLCLNYGMYNTYSSYVVRDGIQVVLSPTGQDTYYNAFYWTK
ncbi:MAG: ABC transporter substrate-binding protein [Clostridiales bacterium]|nr:ABC transporter substrate-binding protein [Clostridiales bacterium]